MAVDNSGLWRICSIREKPSIFGMCMSVKTSAYGSPAFWAMDSRASASSPSSTDVDFMSQRFSIPSRIRRFVRLSSTIRTFTPLNVSGGAVVPTAIGFSDVLSRAVK